jgi:integrase
MMRAMIYLGLRDEETRLMKWSCFNQEQATYQPDKTKNGMAPEMPIPPVMMEWFLKMQQHTLEKKVLSPWICPSPRDSSRPRSRGSANAMLVAAGQKLEIAHLTKHRLRASFCTMLHRAGTPIKTIQKLMRHASVETTMMYIQVDASEMQAAVNEAFA